MINRAVKNMMLTRQFSSAVSRGTAQLQAPTHFPTLWEVSEREAAKQAHQAKSEQAYLDKLKDIN